jgi:hypothetical protein
MEAYREDQDGEIRFEAAARAALRFVDTLKAGMSR